MAVLEELGSKKDIRHVENKEQNGINPCLSVITLNVTGLNSPIKQQRVAEWIKETRSGTSLVAHWLRICLPMHGTQV